MVGEDQMLRRTLLALSMILIFVLLLGNVLVETDDIGVADAGQNLSLGLRLSTEGFYGLRNEQVGYHRREPSYPAVLAALNIARSGLGLARIPLSCGQPQTSTAPACQRPVTVLKSINIVALIVAGLAAGYLVLGLTGSRLWAALAFLSVVFSSQLGEHANFFLTETPAACLMALTSLLSWLAIERRRSIYFILLGLVLAVLVLTKVIFAFLAAAYLLIFVALYFFSQRGDRRFLLQTGAFAISYLIIVGGWMTRNYMVSGHFELVEHRSYKVLSVRASYDTMNADEFWYSFVDFTPMLNETALQRWGVPTERYIRLSPTNENGFRRVGQKQYGQRVEELFGDASGIANPDVSMTRERLHAFDAATRQIANEATARMKSEPLMHARASIALAYQSIFAETGLGMSCRSGRLRLAESWGLKWPCWRWDFSGEGDTFYNGFGLLGLVVLPLLVLLVRGLRAGIIALCICLPALYSHAAYAAISHFNVRYAVPEIPLRNAAFFVIAGMVTHAVIGIFFRRNRRSRSSHTLLQTNFRSTNVA